jgi:arylsulfatase A-like enzyme
VVAATDDAPDGGSPAPRGRFTQVIEGPDRTVVRNEQEYLTDYFGRRSAEFIRREAASGRPYFLYAAFNAPHAPFMVTRKYYDRFPHITDKRNRVYAAMIAALDDAVADIVQAVEQSGKADNTLIYFVSDNGCAAYVPGLCACEPLRGGKLSHYEGGVRVPFLLRWPAKVKAGTVYRKPVSTLDIFPTALAAAGVAPPSSRPFDGVDILPYLQGRQAGDPHPQLMWRRQPLASIRKGDWKLWKDPEAGYTLLFNLRNDPNETTNLARRNPAKVRELEGDIDRWARELQDPRWPSRPPVTYSVCGTPFKVPI